MMTLVGLGVCHDCREALEKDGFTQSPEEIRHRPVGSKTETTSTGWLPASGSISVGLTSGASTPDNLVGAAITKLWIYHFTSVPGALGF